jgi:hypothetical protein
MCTFDYFRVFVSFSTYFFGIFGLFFVCKCMNLFLVLELLKRIGLLNLFENL